MSDPVTVPAKYGAVFNKEGYPVVLSPVKPDIQKAKDLMVLTSEGMVSGELGIGNYGLDPKEVRGVKRLLKDFSPKRTYGLKGFTHPWGDDYLEALARGEKFATSLITDFPKEMIAWQQMFYYNDTPRRHLNSRGGMEHVQRYRGDEHPYYLADKREYRTETVTPEWRNYHGFMTGIMSRFKDVNEQFGQTSPVKNPVLEYLGLTDFRKKPTRNQRWAIGGYLDFADRFAYLKAFGDSQTPALSAGTSDLGQNLGVMMGYLFRDKRNRQDLFWHATAHEEWRMQGHKAGVRANETARTRHTFGVVAEKVDAYGSVQRLLGLTIMSDIGSFVLSSRPITEQIGDPRNREEDNTGLRKVSAAKNDPDFWHTNGYWQLFQEQGSGAKDFLTRMQAEYKSRIAERGGVDVPLDDSDLITFGDILRAVSNEQKRELDKGPEDRINVRIPGRGEVFSVPLDPKERVDYIHWRIDDDRYLKSDWRDLSITDEVDKKLIIAKMLLSESEMAAYLQQVQDQSLDQIVIACNRRDKRNQVRSFVLEDLGWTDLYKPDGGPDWESFRAEQPFWINDRDKEMYARQNWGNEKFRRYALHYGFFPGEEALVDAAAKMFKCN